MGRNRFTLITRSPRAVAPTATRDQWGAHAPKYPELSPRWDQGNTEAIRTTPKPTRASHVPLGWIGSGTFGGGGASTRTFDRHSGPITRPRTGTAHARHRALPHRSQAPTLATAG